MVAQTLITRGLSEAGLKDVADVAIFLISDLHRGTLRDLQYAKRIADDELAVCVATTPDEHERIERRWTRFPKLTADIQLVIIDYDYRDILTPLVEYIDHVNTNEFPDQIVTVVIPEFVPLENYARVLHNQTANILRQRLRSREEVIVIDVPYHIPTPEEIQQEQAVAMANRAAQQEALQAKA
jgi:hypothetical protein